jgi:hypothetical protein
MSDHQTRIFPHDVKSCHIAKHSEGGECGTRYEVRCSCGFDQGADCRDQAAAIITGHRAKPDEDVISWERPPRVTADTITDDQLRDLFARHCECRPLDLSRGEDDHAAIHDCDTAILADIKIVMGIRFADRGLSDDERTQACARCVRLINEHRGYTS